MTVDPNDRILVVGHERVELYEDGTERWNIVLARLNDDGSFDQTFGVGGLVHSDAVDAEGLFDLLADANEMQFGADFRQAHESPRAGDYTGQRRSRQEAVPHDDELDRSLLQMGEC